MQDLPVIAYLTSQYARASDTFIRGEVAQLRALGFTIHTFSIRRPAESEVVSDAIRTERTQTDYVLTGNNLHRIAMTTLRTLLRTPGKLAKITALALRCAEPGLGQRAKSLAYVAEACYLAGRMHAKGVTHLHNQFGEGSAVVAMLVSMLIDIPYSLTIHGPGEFDHPATLALDEKIGRSAFTVSVSDWGRSQMLRWIRIEDAHKIKIVHCGVEDRFIEHPPTPIGTEARLVCVGRLVAEKGFLTLIEAAYDLARSGLAFKIAIVGDGPMRPRIEALIAEHDLGGHVEVLGWMSSDKVQSEILRARAFVLPSYAENLPVALMEAAALSRPVITSYVAGIPELFRDGVHGWLVPASSVAKLSAAMREALTAPPQKLDAMGRAAAAAVAEHHDPRIEAAKLAALFSTGFSPNTGQTTLPAADVQPAA